MKLYFYSAVTGGLCPNEEQYFEVMDMIMNNKVDWQDRLNPKKCKLKAQFIHNSKKSINYANFKLVADNLNEFFKELDLNEIC